MNAQNFEELTKNATEVEEPTNKAYDFVLRVFDKDQNRFVKRYFKNNDTPKKEDNAHEEN